MITKMWQKYEGSCWKNDSNTLSWCWVATDLPFIELVYKTKIEIHMQKKIIMVMQEKGREG